MESYFTLRPLFMDFLPAKSTDSSRLEIILTRRQRLQIKGFNSSKAKALVFQAGDILKVTFKRGGQGYYFEGICLAIRKNKFLSKQSSLVLRNVIYGVGIEIIASYYLNRLYYLGFSDYKRKRLFYPKRKLFFLRLGENQETAL
jgi:ribosomal protein L19